MDYEKNKWTFLITILFYGSIIGIGYQFLKIDLGGDYFWNIRLPISLMLGVLFFVVVTYVCASILKLLLGRYDGPIQRMDAITYLPLCLMVLYPLQKLVWREPFFLRYATLYVLGAVFLKCWFVVRTRRKPMEDTERTVSPSIPGNRWLCASAIVAAVPLFCLHQVTMVFDDNLPDNYSHANESSYLRHNSVTRKIFLPSRRVNLSRNLPGMRSNVTVGYKMLREPEEILDFAVPVLFHIRVKDANETTIFEKKNLLNPADYSSRNWTLLEFDVSGQKGDPLHFKMEAKPLIFSTPLRSLLKILLHNPLDFQYFENLSADCVWCEPEIVPLDEKRPNVILISLDTLRADALGCYGYDLDVSPTIDSFAHENIMFKNAFSQCPSTMPSHLSMFTSRFPNELPALKKDHEKSQVKSISLTTLADIFQENGYYCAAFTDSGYVSAYYGFSKGFHFYNERPVVANISFRLAQDWLRGNSEKNIFLFLHTYIIHDYYRMPERMWEGPWEKEAENILSSIHSVFPEATDLEALLVKSRTPRNKNRYDILIRLVDSYFQEFLSFLKEEGLYDNTMIILISDHGESFREPHNNGKTRLSRHGGGTYDTQIHVPLIIKLPNHMSVGPMVVEDDVSLIDVAPSILAVLGLESDWKFRGRSIVPGFPSQETSGYPFVFAMTRTGKKTSIRQNMKKYIRRRKGGGEYYDLAQDPRETRNLVSLKTEEMQELRAKLVQFISETGETEMGLDEATVEAPEDLRDELKALGYLN